MKRVLGHFAFYVNGKMLTRLCLYIVRLHYMSTCTLWSNEDQMNSWSKFDEDQYLICTNIASFNQEYFDETIRPTNVMGLRLLLWYQRASDRLWLSDWIAYYRLVPSIRGFGVYDRKSICAEIVFHNVIGVFTKQYKANRAIKQTFVEMWIYD